MVGKSPRRITSKRLRCVRIIFPTASREIKSFAFRYHFSKLPEVEKIIFIDFNRESAIWHVERYFSGGFLYSAAENVNRITLNISLLFVVQF